MLNIYEELEEGARLNVDTSTEQHNGALSNVVLEQRCQLPGVDCGSHQPEIIPPVHDAFSDRCTIGQLVHQAGIAGCIGALSGDCVERDTTESRSMGHENDLCCGSSGQHPSSPDALNNYVIFPALMRSSSDHCGHSSLENSRVVVEDLSSFISDDVDNSCYSCSSSLIEYLLGDPLIGNLLEPDSIREFDRDRSHDINVLCAVANCVVEECQPVVMAVITPEENFVEFCENVVGMQAGTDREVFILMCEQLSACRRSIYEAHLRLGGPDIIVRSNGVVDRGHFVNMLFCVDEQFNVEWSKHAQTQYVYCDIDSDGTVRPENGSGDRVMSHAYTFRRLYHVLVKLRIIIRGMQSIIASRRSVRKHVVRLVDRLVLHRGYFTLGFRTNYPDNPVHHMKVSLRTYNAGCATFANSYDPCRGLRMLHLLFESQFMELFMSYDAHTHNDITSERFLYHGYSNMILCRSCIIVEGFNMFGKEFSSDVTGDGPKGGNKGANVKGGGVKDSNKPPMSAKGPATTSALKAASIENPKSGKEMKDKVRTKYTLCDGSCDFVNVNHYHPVRKSGNGTDKPADGAVRRLAKKESENICFAICHDSTEECIAVHHHVDHVNREKSLNDAEISSPALAEIEASTSVADKPVNVGTAKKPAVPIDSKPETPSKIPRPAKKNTGSSVAGNNGVEATFTIDEVHVEAPLATDMVSNPMCAAAGGNCKPSFPPPSSSAGGSAINPLRSVGLVGFAPPQMVAPKYINPGRGLAPKCPALLGPLHPRLIGLRLPSQAPLNVCPPIGSWNTYAEGNQKFDVIRFDNYNPDGTLKFFPIIRGEVSRDVFRSTKPLEDMTGNTRRLAYSSVLFSNPGSRCISNDLDLLEMVTHKDFTLPLHPELGDLGLCKCVNIFVTLSTDRSGWEFCRDMIAGTRLVDDVQTLGNEHRVAITNERRFNSLFEYRNPFGRFTTSLAKRGKITSVSEVNMTQKVGYGRSFYGMVYIGVVERTVTDMRLKNVVTGDGHTTAGIIQSILKSIQRNFADLYEVSNQEVMNNTVMHIVNRVVILRQTVKLSEVYSETAATSVLTLNFLSARRE